MSDVAHGPLVSFFTENTMSFDIDFSQELKSLLEISDDVFCNMSDDTSTTDSRFSQTF